MFVAHESANSGVRILMVLTLTYLLGVSSQASDVRVQASRKQPALLPAHVREMAQPLGEVRGELSQTRLWNVIEAHDAGSLEQLEYAIAFWRHIPLPEESQIWRHVAEGVAHLQCGRFNESENALLIAQHLDNNNAVVHYFIALLRLEQAEAMGQKADAPAIHGRDVTGTPLSNGNFRYLRFRYEIEAIAALELVVRYANDVELGIPLAAASPIVTVPYPAPDPVAAPQVQDLIHALGGDNYVGKAHGLLAHLYIDRGLPVQAEEHTDGALSFGIAVPYGYRWIGRLYEEQGRSKDALRVFTKATKGGDVLAAPGSTPEENLQRRFGQLFQEAG